MNPTPADAENSANWDDTLTPLLMDAMSKVYGYATYSDLCNDDDMNEVWSVADNITRESQALQRQVAALIDAAHNSGHAAQFAKDQAEIWPEAYEEGFVDGRLVENKWWLERSLVPIIGTTYPNRFRARIAELKQSKTEAEQP